MSETLLRDLEEGAACPFWCHFQLATLARVNLSFVPFYEMLCRNKVTMESTASLGSGSCTHEVALALLRPDSEMHCFDVTGDYIPSWTKPYFAKVPGLTFEVYDFAEPLARTFGLVFSIQTLEHVKDVETALNMLTRAVKPSGHLYVDTPVYHEDHAREPDVERHLARVWKNNRHYHLGFSRRKMEARLRARGFTIVDSGYYSYVAGDHALMRYVRESQAERREMADTITVRALNRSLLASLRGCEKAYAPIKDEIDDLVLARRVCYAYRILARRPDNPDHGEPYGSSPGTP